MNDYLVVLYFILLGWLRAAFLMSFWFAEMFKVLNTFVNFNVQLDAFCMNNNPILCVLYVISVILLDGRGV